MKLGHKDHERTSMVSDNKGNQPAQLQCRPVNDEKRSVASDDVCNTRPQIGGQHDRQGLRMRLYSLLVERSETHGPLARGWGLSCLHIKLIDSSLEML